MAVAEVYVPRSLVRRVMVIKGPLNNLAPFMFWIFRF